MVIKRTFESPLMQPQEFEIELTAEERRQAYYEQQAEFDATDMQYYLEEIEDSLIDQRMSKEKIKKLYSATDELGAELRRNIDKYDMSWEYARPAALSAVAGRMFGEAYTKKHFAG